MKATLLFVAAGARYAGAKVVRVCEPPTATSFNVTTIPFSDKAHTDPPFQTHENRTTHGRRDCVKSNGDKVSSTIPQTDGAAALSTSAILLSPMLVLAVTMAHM